MAKDVMITYDTLYEIFRREKYQAELQNLDPNFFKEITNYLSEKESILQSQKTKDNIFSSSEIQKTKKQIESIKKIFKELYEKRESKIVQLALICSRTSQETKPISSLLPEEKQFYEQIVNLLNTYRDKILQNLLETKLPDMEKAKDIKADEEKTKLIRILNPLPKFLGTDLKTYGPFEEEDLASLPSKIADLIVEKKRAEEIKL